MSRSNLETWKRIARLSGDELIRELEAVLKTSLLLLDVIKRQISSEGGLEKARAPHDSSDPEKSEEATDL